MNARRTLPALLLCVTVLAACGDDRPARPHASAHDAGADAADAARDADLAHAAADARAVDAGTDARGSDRCDRLDAPFDRSGDEGKLVARFVSIDPALEYKGHYDWTLELRDTSGRVVRDARLTAEAEMPAHGHGTAPIAVRHETGSSRYELGDVNLFMAGKWDVIVGVRTSAASDRVVFRACPRDPPDAGDDDGGAPVRSRH